MHTACIPKRALTFILLFGILSLASPHPTTASLPAPLPAIFAFQPLLIDPAQYTKEPFNMERLAILGGTSGAVAQSGNLVLLGKGLKLLLLDATNPSAPFLLGECGPLPGYISGVAVNGSYAYLAAQSAGLIIIDIDDPIHPRQIASVKTSSSVVGVHIHGHYILLAENEAGLRILDGTDPYDPREISHLDTPDHALSVTAVGEHVFIADGSSGLRIINIADIYAPREIGSHPGIDFTLKVQVVGDYAYLANGYAGMVILDIHDYTKPIFVRSIASFGPTMDLAIAGSFAFFNATFGENRVYVVDISNPASAYVVGSYQAVSYPRFLQVSNNLLLISDYAAGLHLVDVSAPQTPLQVGLYSHGIFNANDVAVSGRFAYIAGAEGGLHVIDICDSHHPRIVGSLKTNFRSVEVSGNYAYLSGSDMEIIDISQPQAPAPASLIKLYYPSKDAKVTGDLLYIAARDLYIYNISDPAHPAPVAEYTSRSEIEALDIAGNHAYLSMRGGINPGGLEIVEISAAPHSVGFLPISVATDVKVRGNYAYLAASDNNLGSGLYIIDITDLTAPFLVSVFPAQDVPAKVALYQNYALLASTFGGVYAIDISDPYHPVEAAYYPAEIAVGVQVENGLVYLANGAYGFNILGLTGAEFPPVYNLCGVVKDFSGSPVPEVTLLNTSSVENGAYFAGGIPQGSLTVIPSRPGYRFWPSHLELDFPPDQVDQNFLASSATLLANYESGAQTSYFWLTGQGYSPGQTVTVYTNGQLLGNLDADSSGRLSFRISSELADDGEYIIYIDDVTVINVTLSLSMDRPLHALEGSGPIFSLPAGIAFDRKNYLPAAFRSPP